ncbi:MAG: serine/threonine protein kinase [Candidatus Obscuribacter phosphatis]|uniref:non-specific serine/threonine protein kinase n=1 Tax=Candidatus Obscuribacter phosphatis TaxID=1906157 RepID=A0A8J7TK78_9BACT|nr:serine/threonine protein kinase [Candidatus Obscuribacter phosphatis]
MSPSSSNVGGTGGSGFSECDRISAQEDSESSLSPYGFPSEPTGPIHSPGFVSTASVFSQQYKVGDVVDGVYELVSVLGRGGMGVVFAARHKLLGKLYALKLINKAEVDEIVLARFKAEAMVLARLRHRAIVSVHNMGVDRGRCIYYVMDLLDGETLSAHIKNNGPLHFEQAIGIFSEVAEALGVAHERGIVHRDVKPSNIMLIAGEKYGELQTRLVDFGIARLNIGSQSHTATGSIFGTPFYMSPEQCEGATVDGRSDIYSLGCSLFETLTGRPPFRGGNPFQTFYMHLNMEPPTLTSVNPQGDFPGPLEDCLRKMLAKNPENRYRDTKALLHDFERVLGGKPVALELRLRQEEMLESDPDEDAEDSEPESAGIGSRIFAPALIAISLAFGSGAVFWSQQKFSTQPTKIEKIVDRQVASAAKDLQQDPRKESFERPYKMRSVLESPRVEAGAGLDAAGATQEEFEAVDSFYLFRYKPLEQAQYIATQKFILSKRPGFRYATRKPQPGFVFPNDFVAGEIQIGSSNPRHAYGFIARKKDEPVTFYLNAGTRDYPELIDYFADGDLYGLEFISNKYEHILNRCMSWKSLRVLSFFNPLSKCIPRHERYDECDIDKTVLSKVEKMPWLIGLGLCGPEISGGDVARLKILPKLKILKLKRIADTPSLYPSLQKSSNLNELWLVATDTTDGELSEIAKIPNLETLRIRRSKLTPASLMAFKKMKKLKHLYLDRHWSEDELAKFKAEIPGFQTEPIYDSTYMQLMPPGLESRSGEDF